MVKRSTIGSLDIATPAAGADCRSTRSSGLRVSSLTGWKPPTTEALSTEIQTRQHQSARRWLSKGARLWAGIDADA